MAAADAVADAMRELTACAQAAGLKVASHDDPDAATRRYYHQLGCGVAEFLLTREAVAWPATWATPSSSAAPIARAAAATPTRPTPPT